MATVITEKLPVQKAAGSTWDILAVEAEYQIDLNGCFWQKVLCTPAQLTELTAGLLWEAGMITAPRDILSIKVEDPSKKIDAMIRDTQSKTVREPENKSAKISLPISQYSGIMKILEGKAALFTQTGAAHSALLCRGSEPLYFTEDISRHNAMYKLLGHAFLNDIPLEDKIVALTCRLTTSIVSLAAEHGIGVLLSRSAATTGGVEKAKASNMTLVGFIRGQDMNVYC